MMAENEMPDISPDVTEIARVLDACKVPNPPSGDEVQLAVDFIAATSAAGFKLRHLKNYRDGEVSAYGFGPGWLMFVDPDEAHRGFAVMINVRHGKYVGQWLIWLNPDGGREVWKDQEHQPDVEESIRAPTRGGSLKVVQMNNEKRPGSIGEPGRKPPAIIRLAQLHPRHRQEFQQFHGRGARRCKVWVVFENRNGRVHRIGLDNREPAHIAVAGLNLPIRDVLRGLQRHTKIHHRVAVAAFPFNPFLHAGFHLLFAGIIHALLGRSRGAVKDKEFCHNTNLSLLYATMHQNPRRHIYHNAKPRRSRWPCRWFGETMPR
jgi:hypothetical protein